MTRKACLTIVASTAVTVGLLALIGPGILIEDVKTAAPSDAANTMARTVGVLLLSIGILNFLVRNHENSPTLRAVFLANLILQLAILPIDPIAYAQGVYGTPASFVPNTILHLFLAIALAHHLAKLKREGGAPSRAKASAG